MKKFKISILLCLLFSVFVFKLSAQDNTREKTAADKEYEAYNYKNAISAYLTEDTTNVFVIGRLANAYRLVKNYENAEIWYTKLVALKADDKEVLVQYAEVLANNGQYETAEKWYRKYLELNSSSAGNTSVAKSYQDLASFYIDSAAWKVDYLSINTDRDEFSPAYFGRGLIFTTNRSHSVLTKRVFGWDQMPFTDLFVAPDTSLIKTLQKKIDDENAEIQLRKVVYNDDDTRQTANDSKTLASYDPPKVKNSSFSNTSPTKVRPLSRTINSKYHDGPATLPLDQYSMMFNRNNYYKGKEGESKEGVNMLKIYMSNYVGGQWFNLKEFKYNNDEYSTGHPALSPDGDILYFVSNMPGGFGGSDIYMSKNEAGKGWSQPKNLGPAVNTSGNEMFPYVDYYGDLYFSSDGWTGLGGLDIFYIKTELNMPVGKPKNMGYPVNSSKDDFGIIMMPDKKNGYLSSNRLLSDDIYKFNYKPIEINLKGSVAIKNKLGLNEVIKDAKVRLRAINQIDSILTPPNGAFKWSLNPHTDYEIEVTKEGYTTQRVAITTKGLTKSKTIEVNVVLQKIEDPQKIMLANCDSLRKRFFVENIYYDLDKSNITKRSETVLETLTGILEDNPEADVIISSHTDSRASGSYNEKLSNRRSQSVKQFLIAKGIDGSRLQTQYFGESRLVNKCKDGEYCPEDLQQLNRRTEFYIVLNGINITLDCKF